MTPLHWQMLLHYYAIAEPYAASNPGHANSLAVKACTKELIERDLIWADASSGSGYRATERGEFLVNHICGLPLPISEWRMPAHPPADRGST